MPPETDKAFEQFDAFMESVLDRLNERDQELAGAHTLIADLRKENAALRRQGGAGVHDTLNDGDSSRRLQDARRRVLRTLHPNATVGLPEEVRVAREEAFKEIWPAFDKS